jgi:hypothetical protein
MKTTNNAQKTENKKLENPVSKTFAVVLSLVLISLTVSANGFWKQLLVNNTYGKMATLMVDQQKENEALLAFSTQSAFAPASESTIATGLFGIETAKEKNLEIESWMTNETYFGSNLMNNQVAQEKPFEIENWMIDNIYFNLPVVAAESEPALQTEAWMLDDKIWNN